MSGNSLIIQFDRHVLRSKPKVLRDLAELYCNVFSLDPNFGEYRQCPTCSRYFNYEQVESEGIHVCDNNHPETTLVYAWEQDKVEDEILTQAAEPGFYGANALLHGKLVGFAWARVISFNEVRKHWGDTIIDLAQPHAQTDLLVYFDELAVGLEARDRGLGKGMARFICEWAKREHPEDMTLLRTHRNSKAKGIYEALGYEVFADDTEYGGGRVMMKANRCSDLNVNV